MGLDDVVVVDLGHVIVTGAFEVRALRAVNKTEADERVLES